MGDKFISELIGLVGNGSLKNNTEKPNIARYFDSLKPSTTQYRIKDGQKDYDYKRDTLLPRIEDSQIVLQSTYSKAGGDTGIRFLETSGAGPCVVATLYDTVSKTGLMVHFDSRSNIAVAIKEMKKQLNGDSSKWQMRIIGGYLSEKSSISIVEEIRNSANYSKIPIIEEDILKNGSLRRDVNIVLDTETGNLYDLPEDAMNRYSQTQKETLGLRLEELLTDQRVAMGEVKFIQNILD
jgi:hypothetical protein